MQTIVAHNAHQCANTGLVLLIDGIAQAAALWREFDQDNAAIMGGGNTHSQIEAFQAIHDARHITFIGEQDTAQIDHRAPTFFIQMFERPELANTQTMFGEELAIAIIEQIEDLVEQVVSVLLEIPVLVDFTHNSARMPLSLDMGKKRSSFLYSPLRGAVFLCRTAKLRPYGPV